jgi:hypothetical protein
MITKWINSTKIHDDKGQEAHILLADKEDEAYNIHEDHQVGDIKLFYISLCYGVMVIND